MEKYKDFNLKKVKQDIEFLTKQYQMLDKQDQSHLEVQIAEQLCMDAISILIDYLDEDKPSILQNGNYKLPSQTEIFKSCIQEDFNALTCRQEYIKYIQQFSILGIYSFYLTPAYNDYIKTENIPDRPYTNEDILTFIHDFYMTIEDEEIKDTFLKNFKYKDSYLRLKGKNSETHYMPIIQRPYITIANNTSKVKQVINGIHEYGHAISMTLDEKYVAYESTYPFIELMSTTLEKLGEEYLIKTDPESYEKAQEDRLDYLASMIEFSKTLCIQNDIKEKNYKYLKCAENYCLKKFGKEELKNILHYPAFQTFNYVFPFSVSIELLKIYETDPEYAMMLMKILDQTYKVDYLKELNDLEITPNEHLEEYVKHLTKKKES